jgi:MFS family permease
VLRQDRRFVAFLIPVVAVTGMSSVSVFLVPMALRGDLSDAYVGYFAVAASAAGILGPPIQGWLADQWGRGRTAMAGAALAATGLIAFAHVPFGQWSTVAYGVITIGGSAVYSMIYLSVLDLSPSAHRPTYVAVRYGLQGLVSAPLYLVCGWALDHVPIAWVIYAAAGCGLFCGVLMLRVAGRAPAYADVH